MTYYYSLFFMLSSLALLLSGCDTVRSTLGLDHYQADPFNVPTNPPLTLPPEYTLRPPAPGAAPTFSKTSNTQAQQTLSTYNAQVYSSNATENGLVGQMKTGTPPANIRELVDKEAHEESNLGGKLGKQVDDWKTQAKKNIASIYTNDGAEKQKDSSPPPQPQDPKTTS